MANKKMRTKSEWDNVKVPTVDASLENSELGVNENARNILEVAWIIAQDSTRFHDFTKDTARGTSLEDILVRL